MLSLRSYVVYALSKLDYVGAGVRMSKKFLNPLELATRSYYRGAMGLGPWGRNKFLTLPMALGGPGAPDLSLCMDLA